MSDQEKAQPIDVYQVLAIMVDQLAELAWQKMGLKSDPLTGQIEKDLEQAKAAVDSAAELSKFLVPKLDDADKRQIENLVRDLRVNYVEKSQG